jgi:hypothetical protein
MNQILAYSFLIGAGLISIIPIYKYLYTKYYYVDTTPIHYWSNRKQRAKKRYKTLRKYKSKKRNSYLAVINKYKLTSRKLGCNINI